MKIVMICEFYDEGLEYQDNLLAKYYRKHGHDVAIITSTISSVFDYIRDRDRGRGTSFSYETPEAKVIRLPFRVNLLNRIKIFPPLDALFADEAPDLIFFHDIIPNILEGVAYVRTHPECRLIMDYHADYSNSGKNWLSLRVLHGIIRKWFLDRARPHLQRIFPIVPGSADFLREIYRVPPEEMELLPLGTDLEFGRAVRAAGEGKRLRRSLDIPDDAFVIFTGGKLGPLKKTEHLIDAVCSIDDDRVRLLIVGKPEPAEAAYGETLQERAAGDRRIMFRGWLDRNSVYAHLDASDVAIFPASQSVLWQQAIGMGLPLMLSERSDLLPCHQDVSYLNLYDNVIVLDHEQPLAAEIARHIRRLIGDPGLLSRMSEGAHRTASEILDWDKLIERTLRFNAPAGAPVRQSGLLATSG